MICINTCSRWLISNSPHAASQRLEPVLKYSTRLVSITHSGGGGGGCHVHSGVSRVLIMKNIWGTNEPGSH